MNSVHHNKTIHDNVAATQRQRLQARPRIIAQPSWVGAVPIEPYHSFLSLYITLTLGHQFIYPFNLTNKLLHAISHAFPFPLLHYTQWLKQNHTSFSLTDSPTLYPGLSSGHIQPLTVAVIEFFSLSLTEQSNNNVHSFGRGTNTMSSQCGVIT